MIWSALQLSILVSIAATSAVFIIGLAAAFVLAKCNFPGKELLDAVLTMPLVLPPTVTGFYLLVLLGRNGLVGSFIFSLTNWQITFTWYAAVVAAFVTALPLMIRSARAAIETVDPQFEMASRNLGRGLFKTFFFVTMPLARRGIVAGTILSFARALGEFGATPMLAGNIAGQTQTMPLAIYEAVVSGNDKLAQTLSLVLTIVSIVAVYLTNKLVARKR